MTCGGVNVPNIWLWSRADTPVDDRCADFGQQHLSMPNFLSRFYFHGDGFGLGVLGDGGCKVWWRELINKRVSSAAENIRPSAEIGSIKTGVLEPRPGFWICSCFICCCLDTFSMNVNSTASFCCTEFLFGTEVKPPASTLTCSDQTAQKAIRSSNVESSEYKMQVVVLMESGIILGWLGLSFLRVFPWVNNSKSSCLPLKLSKNVYRCLFVGDTTRTLLLLSHHVQRGSVRWRQQRQEVLQRFCCCWTSAVMRSVQDGFMFPDLQPRVHSLKLLCSFI